MSAVHLTKLDVETITTLQALAAPDCPVVVADLARDLARDADNLRKTFKALEAAGRVVKVDGSPVPALTDDGRAVVAAWARAHDPAPVADGTMPGAEIPLDLIDEDPDLNPRTTFDEDELAGLAASVREKGVIQPILIRPHATAPGRFLVVAGSRRTRASKAAGLATIPAVIRHLTDVQALEIAALENMQRADMNPLDEAVAFERIIAARRAADPALSLKDAKEAVSGAIGKTVRFIELRLQLLELPPAKRAALTDGSLGLTDARKWLQQRPKMLELSPRQWLIALEVYDAQHIDPVPRKYEHEAAATLCRTEAAADADVAALTAAQMLNGPSEIFDDGERTGKLKVRFPDHRLEQLRLKFGEVADDDLRAKALVTARKAAGVKGAVPAGQYATEWLNAPFDVPADVLAEIAAEKAERAASQEQQQRQAAAEAEANAAREAEGAQRLAALPGILEGFGKSRVAGILEAQLAALLAKGEKPLPWWPSDRGGILAANGAPVLHDYPPHQQPAPDTLFRVKVMAFAVNLMAGLATPEAPPEQEAAEPNLADVLEEAANEYQPDDEDADEGELEDAAADDEEIPTFLRRLAGPLPAAAPTL